MLSAGALERLGRPSEPIVRQRDLRMHFMLSHPNDGVDHAVESVQKLFGLVRRVFEKDIMSAYHIPIGGKVHPFL